MKDLKRRTMTIAVLLLAGIALPAAAQRTTEQFIPLGKSPGVSGISAYMGSINAVDAARRTVTLGGPQGETTIKVTDSTLIWFDHSKDRKPTTMGKLSDLKVGMNAEVKYLNPAKKDVAEWIKVEAGGS